jgi:general secretion pathway protein D
MSRLRFPVQCVRAVWAALAVSGLGSLASAQPGRPPVQPQQGQQITLNFRDTDILQVAEAVSAVTNKNFIIDPRVRAQVTVMSSMPMSPAAVYEAFLAILQVHGFIAVPDGNVVKILPDANARTIPSIDLPDSVSSTSDEIVTQVVDVKNVSAAQLVPILRPLSPQYAHLAAYTPSNVLIISDRASNVNRLIRIIRRIDQVGDQDVEIVPLQNASAAEIVRVVNSLYTAQAAAAEGGTPVKVVADERSNAVLISGDQSQRLRIRTLVASLDTPLEHGGDTQVVYLHFADAEKLAPKLKEQITGLAAAAGGGGAPGAGQSAQAVAEKNATIWPDPPTNALVITAPPMIMRSILSIIDKLDIRRPQVLVEAIIAEVNLDKDAELGVNWAIFDKSAQTNVPVGGFVSPVGGTSIVDLAQAAQNPASASTTLLQGTTLGIGRIAGTGINFAAMLRAIRGDTNTNIIATPSTVTMDNQEAELKVAQEVPFITGQFTNTGTTTAGAVNPFQTIQREEVGTILKVTPQITTEGNSVVMKLSIESSSIGQKPAGAVDLITNKRTVTTNVLIEDGGIVVIGGLIEHDNVQGENAVPFLSKIPLIGQAFKTRNITVTKNNLMIFIRPKIIRDAAQAAYATESKYKYMMQQEHDAELHQDIIPLLPGEKRPRLAPLPPPPPAGTNLAPASTAEKEKAAAANQKRQETQPPGQPDSSGTTVAPATPAQGAAAPPSPGAPAPQEQAVPATPDESLTPPAGKGRSR